MSQYAEIHVYEPYLTCDGLMEWRPLTELTFDRDFLGTRETELVPAAPGEETSGVELLRELSSVRGSRPAARPRSAATVDRESVREIVAHTLGMPAAGLRPRATPIERREADEPTGVVPAGGVNQVTVNQFCDDGKCRGEKKKREFALFKFDDWHWGKGRRRVEDRQVVVPVGSSAGGADVPVTNEPAPTGSSPGSAGGDADVPNP